MMWKKTGMRIRSLGPRTQPDPVRDKYLPVVAEGSFTGQTLYVLSGMPEIGAGVEVFARTRLRIHGRNTKLVRRCERHLHHAHGDVR